MKNMGAMMQASAGLLVVSTVLLGGVYPLVVTIAAQGIFSHEANGSLLVADGKVVGSELLGQQFEDPKYFWGRLSATMPPYNAAASGGSNLNPSNPKLLEAANARIAQLQQADYHNKARIPQDLITSSASGLDPHISEKAAEYQIPRIARARHIKEEVLKTMVKNAASNHLLGDPHVNVLTLNMALDDKH